MGSPIISNRAASDDVRDLLGQHLSLTKGEAVARLQKDWDADVAAFDDIFTEILTMADALTDGIVAQFPERFGETDPGTGGAPRPGQGARHPTPLPPFPAPSGRRP